jgi:hypothetical protein
MVVIQEIGQRKNQRIIKSIFGKGITWIPHGQTLSLEVYGLFFLFSNLFMVENNLKHV